jgi:hypothetical protein
MKLKSVHIAPIIFVAFVAGIGGTMLAGLWRTESSKVPVKYETGEFAGEYNPGDIRGSYSFGEISELFDIPVEDLGMTYDVQKNPGAFQVKSLEEMYGEIEGPDGTPGEIGTDSVRWFVSLYVGLPYMAAADTLLPASAASVLQDRVDEKTLQALKKYMVQLGEAAQTESASEEPADHELEDIDTTVKGKTTFGELLQWGVTREEIEEILMLPMGEDNEAVRDFCIEKEIEFSVVKTPLQGIIDAKK